MELCAVRLRVYRVNGILIYIKNTKELPMKIGKFINIFICV